MSQFELASWFLTFLTTLTLIYLGFAHRYMVVKPSFIFSIFYVGLLQWPSAVGAQFIEMFLRDPWDYFWLIHVFPLITLLASAAFRNVQAREVFSRICQDGGAAERVPGFVLALLGGVCVFIIFTYLLFVPFRETGLYTIFTDPKAATAARESSLKLLDNQLLKYGCALLEATLSPILAILCSFRLAKAIRERNIGNALASLAGILGTLLAVSLSGARGPSAVLMLAVCFALLLKSKVHIRVSRLIAVFVVVLIFPVLINLFREGKSLNFETLLFYFVNVMERTFGKTILAGIWHVDYVQRFGYFGVGGLGKLANLFGEVPVQTFNVVGFTYDSSVDSVSAGTTYVIAYFSLFGFWAFIPCVLLALALDCAIPVYLRTPKRYLVPAVAAGGITVQCLIATLYTQVLFTFGLIPILLLSLWLARADGGSKWDAELVELEGSRAPAF